MYDELERLVSLAQEEISQLLSQDEQLEKLLALFTANGGLRIPTASIVFLMHYGLTSTEKSSGQRRISGRYLVVDCQPTGATAGAGDFPDTTHPAY